jgi:hypothetical protein
MTQAFGHPRPVDLEFVLDKVVLGRVFLRLLQISRSYNSTAAPYLSIYL